MSPEFVLIVFQQISKYFRGYMRYIILWVFVLVFLVGCGQRWNGFFYPNGVGGEVVRSSTFKTKKECLNWCIQKAQSSPNPEVVDYECGKNCKINEFELFICDETIDG